MMSMKKLKSAEKPIIIIKKWYKRSGRRSIYALPENKDGHKSISKGGPGKWTGTAHQSTWKRTCPRGNVRNKFILNFGISYFHVRRMPAMKKSSLFSLVLCK